jgi:hypothetical protein
VYHADVPFPMLVAEQFDRLVALLEGCHRRDEGEGSAKAVALERADVLRGLAWRVITRHPKAAGRP